VLASPNAVRRTEVFSVLRRDIRRGLERKKQRKEMKEDVKGKRKKTGGIPAGQRIYMT
jgi:hypothetical protein